MLELCRHCYNKGHFISGNIAVSERQYTINVFDTSGDHLQKPTRELCYRSSEVIVIVFSVVKRSSFENVRDFWLPEIKRSLGRNKKPIVLVGCQTDLRHYGSKRYRNIVRTEEAKHVAAKCGLDFYMECSTALLVGVRDVFENIAWSALKNRSNGFNILRRLSKLCCCTCTHPTNKTNAKT